MGFKEVKAQAIRMIREGAIFHVPREYEKNEYAQGLLSDKQVIDMIKICRGDNYEAKPHHLNPHIEVHILKPQGKYSGYYVKFYFLEPDICFISVHKTAGGV